jgi:hypothetical protein
MTGQTHGLTQDSINLVAEQVGPDCMAPTARLITA